MTEKDTDICETIIGLGLILFIFSVLIVVPIWNYYIIHSFDVQDLCDDEYWEYRQTQDNNITHHCMELLGGYRW